MKRSHIMLVCGALSCLALVSFILPRLDASITKRETIDLNAAGADKSILSTTFAGNGKTAYIYKSQKKTSSANDAEYFISVDGQTFGPYSDYPKHLNFSKHKAKMAYVTREGDSRYAYIDNERLGPFRWCSDIQFMGAEDTPVYRTGDESNQQEVHIGNRTQGPFEANSIDDLFLVSDNNTIVYQCKYNGKRYLVIGDSVHGPYDSISIHMSRNKQKFTCSVEMDSKWYVLNDNEVNGPFDSTYIPIFSQNENAFAYAAVVGTESYVYSVKDKSGTQKMGPYMGIYGLALTQDGERVIYSAQGLNTDNHPMSVPDVYLFANNAVVAGPFFNARLIGISPDTTKMVYAAQEKTDGPFAVFINKRKLANCDDIGESVFSPEGNSFACINQNGKKDYLLLGKQKIKLERLDRIQNLTFSFNGDKIAYTDSNRLYVGELKKTPFYEYYKFRELSFVSPEILTDSASYKIKDVRFSPDGKTLAYNIENRIDSTGEKDLYTVITEGNETYIGNISGHNKIRVIDGKISTEMLLVNEIEN